MKRDEESRVCFIQQDGTGLDGTGGGRVRLFVRRQIWQQKETISTFAFTVFCQDAEVGHLAIDRRRRYAARVIILQRELASEGA